MGSPKKIITAQNADITRDLIRAASGFSSGGTRFAMEAGIVAWPVNSGIITGRFVEGRSLAPPCLSRIISSCFFRIRRSYARTGTAHLSGQVAGLQSFEDGELISLIIHGTFNGRLGFQFLSKVLVIVSTL